MNHYKEIGQQIDREKQRYEKLNRKQAKAFRQLVYFDESYTCKFGHHGWRMTVTTACRTCFIKISRRYQRKKYFPDTNYSRKKLDDALFEKKMQKMIDQDYLD